jgi:hypothetical protein
MFKVDNFKALAGAAGVCLAVAIVALPGGGIANAASLHTATATRPTAAAPDTGKAAIPASARPLVRSAPKDYQIVSSGR